MAITDILNSRASPDGTQRHGAFSPELKDDRKEILKTAGIALGLIIIVLGLFQSLYFGAYYRQEENAYRLTIRVIDLDSQYAATVAGAPDAVLGPAVQNAIAQNIQTYPGYHLGWDIASSEDLSMFKLTDNGQGINASTYARDLVTDQTVFGVIIINANATAAATEAVQQGQTSYDGRGAMSLYYEEARNFYSEDQYVQFLSIKLMHAAILQASSQFASRFLQNADAATLTTASSGSIAITQPFGYSLFNLRPFDQLGAEAPTTAGAIYLIIFTFMITPLWHNSFGAFRKKLNVLSEIILTLAVPIASYFWISLCYSLVTLAFGVSFERKYGHVGFFIYWMLNWCTMSALGLTMECAFTLLGILYFAYFLVAFVIINVSVAFLDLADMDPLYGYGFAFPVWNSVDATKSIIFATKNHLVQNFVVCLGWIIVTAILLTLITLWQRHKTLSQEAKEKKN